jgi:hypothetical protein
MKAHLTTTSVDIAAALASGVGPASVTNDAHAAAQSETRRRCANR